MAWQRKSSPEEINPWFLRENPGFQIVPELTPLPREGIFDKITMSAFEGTWFDIALRDCGINAFVVVGVATEIGIDPTIRHGADLGYIPVFVTDACGAGNEEAARRSIENFKFIGDAFVTDTETICRTFRGVSKSFGTLEVIRGIDVLRIPIKRCRGTKLKYVSQYSAFLMASFWRLALQGNVINVRSLRQHGDSSHPIAPRHDHQAQQ